MPRQQRDRAIVRDFLRRRAEVGGITFGAPTWFDDVKHSGKVVECLVPVVGGGEFGIEHTALLSHPEMFQDHARFDRWKRPLQDELDGMWPGFRVVVALPYQPGVKWDAVGRAVLRNWLLQSVPTLPVAGYAHEYGEVTLPGVSSPARVSKNKSSRPQLILRRFQPQGVTVKTLDATMAHALKHKYEELGALQGTGLTSVLILESHDMSLFAEEDYYRAFINVTRTTPHQGLDEVWIATTTEGASHRTTEFYPFRASDSVIEQAKPASFPFNLER